MNRRSFLRNSTLLTAAFALGGNTASTANTPRTMPGTKPGKRRISGMEVNPIGLGCMSMAGVYNAAMPKPDMVRLIRLAVEHGFAWALWSYGGAFGIVDAFDNSRAEPDVLDMVRHLPPR